MNILSVFYSVRVGGGFSYNNGMGFTTKGNDNDEASLNCAKDKVGVWWYKVCSYVNLNGVYSLKTPKTHWHGLCW